jgi:pectinesterase
MPRLFFNCNSCFYRLKIFFIILSLAGVITAVGQKTPLPRDTSFTVLSSYIKEKKNFPFIEIAKPAFPAHIDSSDKIVYDSIGDRPLELQVFYPTKNKNSSYPGVLLIHGGGWRTGDPLQMNALAWQLASLGYITVAVSPFFRSILPRRDTGCKNSHLLDEGQR